MTQVKFLTLLLLLAAVSGCLGHKWFEGGISNSTDQPQTVYLQIDYSQGETGRIQLVNTTINMTANSYHSLKKISDKDGTYEVRVRLENGLEKFGMTGFSQGGGSDKFSIKIQPGDVEISFYHTD